MVSLDPIGLGGQTLVYAAPLVLAATGGYLSERSGVINIALEGKMLAACATLALTAPKFGPAGGLALAILASVLLSVLHWTVTQLYRVDGIISGMVINALALGGTHFAAQTVGTGSEFPALPRMLYYVLAFSLPVVVQLYTNGTRGGLRLVASGADPDKARLVGVEPLRVRFFALVGTGVLCGLAGSLLVTEVGAFGDEMTAGRGYIALAALILGAWRAVPTLVVCVLFGLTFALQIQLKGQGGVPSEVWTMLPYLATLVALAGARRRQTAPAGLGRV